MIFFRLYGCCHQAVQTDTGRCTARGEYCLQDGEIDTECVLVYCSTGLDLSSGGDVMTTRSKLDRAVNLAFILGVITLIATIVFNRVTSSTSSSTVATGDTLGPPAVHRWTDSRATIVLVLRSQCEYCEANVPLYRQLASSLPSWPSVRMLAVFPESSDSANQFLQRHNLQLASESGQSVTELTRDWRIGGFPTVLLVSAGGRVLNVWNGQLTDSGVAHLLDVLSLLAASPAALQTTLQGGINVDPGDLGKTSPSATALSP